MHTSRNLTCICSLLWTSCWSIGLADELGEYRSDDDLATRSALLDWRGGPKEYLRSNGIELDLSLTQFYQGQTSGDDTKSWQYGGTGDIIAAIDAQQLGLWQGFSVKLHQEFVYGDDANVIGVGATFPVNTTMGFPRLLGSDSELSVVLIQQLTSNTVLSLGKFNMVEAASRVPLLGGGGVDTFMNMAFAAPFSGVTPPYIVGGQLSIRTEPVTLGLFVYDPRNAQDSDVVRNPFNNGVTYSLSATMPIEISGLRGFQSFRAVYSTKRGYDLDDVPELNLPDELQDSQGSNEKYWYLNYSFQQFIQHVAGDPSKGWGLFGSIAVSDADPNPVSAHLFLGLGGNSFISGRTDDRWGIGYFNYQLSDHLNETARRDLGISYDAEQGIEIFYNFFATPWLRITADLQVIDPFPSNVSNVFYAGIRLQTLF